MLATRFTAALFTDRLRQVFALSDVGGRLIDALSLYPDLSHVWLNHRQRPIPPEWLFILETYVIFNKLTNPLLSDKNPPPPRPRRWYQHVQITNEYGQINHPRDTGNIWVQSQYPTICNAVHYRMRPGINERESERERKRGTTHGKGVLAMHTSLSIKWSVTINAVTPIANTTPLPWRQHISLDWNVFFFVYKYEQSY